jgi:GAF domain-containing protein
VRFSPEAVAARQKALETRKYQTVKLRKPGDAGGPRLVSLNLPLLVRGRLIGVLEAYGPEAPTERQYEETLISLANQGASALENARLYAELAERENRLQDLIRKLITAQEEEHRKISYEVHNGLAQRPQVPTSSCRLSPGSTHPTPTRVAKTSLGSWS